MKKTNDKVTAIVRKFFKENDWNVHEDISRMIFSGGIGLGSQSAISSVQFFLSVEDHYVINHVVIPQKAVRNVSAVMEYITRANFGLAMGNFELDLRDGEIRYKHMVNNIALLHDYKYYMKELLALPCQMIKRYGGGLMAIIFGDKSPLKEIEAVEGEII